MFTVPRAPITLPSMNPWESEALAHNFPGDTSPSVDDKEAARSRLQSQQDPIIYPGLYAPSGIDIMSVLFNVFTRADPTVQLGPVDCSAAVTVSNLDLPGSPIVYANEAFSELTGYTTSEVVGTLLDQHSTAIRRLEEAEANRNEIQLYITNFKKNGQRFTNLLSMIPIRLPNDGTQYCVGFHVSVD